MAQDLASVRDLVEKEQMFVVLARVALHEGQTSHWYITDEGHIAVRVLTHRFSAPIDALLPSGDDDGIGGWSIPSIGTEVAVGFDGGDYENDAFVLAVYGSKPISSLAERKLFMVGDEVHVVGPGQTSGVPLALKSDAQGITDRVNDLIGKYVSHTHLYAPGPGTPVPTAVAVPTETGISPDPVGTNVLKGR